MTKPSRKLDAAQRALKRRESTKAAMRALLKAMTNAQTFPGSGTGYQAGCKPAALARVSGSNPEARTNLNGETET